MAAIVPAVKGEAGYCPPGYLYMNALAASPDNLANGKLIHAGNLIHEVYTFTDVDSADLWTPPVGTVAVAQSSHNLLAGTLNTLNGNARHRWQGGTNATAVAHIWKGRGNRGRATGTNEPPAAYGAAGYHTPRVSSFYPSALPPSVPRRPQFLGAKHLAFYFPVVNEGDTWAISRAMRIIDCAWQAAGTTDAADAAPTLVYTPTSGLHNQLEFVSGADVNGWLHCWFKG